MVMETGLLLQVASTFTSTPIESVLRSALVRERIADGLGFVQYGQMTEYMLSPLSDSTHILGTAVLVRVEDWLRQDLKSRTFDSAVGPWARQQLRMHLDEFVSHLTTLARRGKQVWFVACPSSGWIAEQHRLGTLLKTYTNLLVARVQNIPHVTVLNWPVSLMGDIDDRGADRLGQIPYTQDAFDQLGEILGSQLACTLVQRTSDTSAAASNGSSPELAAYLAGLQVQVELAAAGPRDRSHLDRILRTAATFSLTGEKRDLAETEIDSLLESQSSMLIRVSDRLSDQGPSGVVVFHAAGDALVVDSMALSCAVLGKQVEYAAVSALVQLATERHFSRLVFEYNPSGRNQLTVAFLQSIADRESDTRYVLPLALAEARLSAGAVSAGAWTVKIGTFADSFAVH
jgi:hypothetical protein